MKAYSAKDLWAYEDSLYTLQSALNTARVYEVFTKDDVISMFAELQSDVEECVDGAEGSPQFEQGVTNARIQVVWMIQEKINTLDNGDATRGNTAVWIKRKNTPRGYGEYLCSACMNKNGTDDLLTTYCLDCGAFHGKDKKTVEENIVETPNYSEIPTDSTTKNDLDIINGLDDFIEFGKKAFGVELTVKKSNNPDTYAKLFETTKNDLVREFEGIEVTYPPEEVCAYPEYKGKPYYAIKYKENGEEMVGYGTYNPEVLSQYLRDYFMPSVTPQEPAIDKIRAEIKALPTEHTAFGYNSVGNLWTLKLISSDSVLEILDKYRAKSEDE